MFALKKSFGLIESALNNWRALCFFNGNCWSRPNNQTKLNRKLLALKNNILFWLRARLTLTRFIPTEYYVHDQKILWKCKVFKQVCRLQAKSARGHFSLKVSISWAFSRRKLTFRKQVSLSNNYAVLRWVYVICDIFNFDSGMFIFEIFIDTNMFQSSYAILQRTGLLFF